MIVHVTILDEFYSAVLSCDTCAYLSQHVMKFAELSQEVLITKSQQVQFNTGLTPGRRRMHQEYVEKVAMGDVIQGPPPTTPRPSLSYNLGPPFPLLEVRMETGLHEFYSLIYASGANM